MSKPVITVVINKKTNTATVETAVQSDSSDETKATEQDEHNTQAEEKPSLPSLLDKSSLLALFDVEAFAVNNATDSNSLKAVQEQRLALYHAQYERTRQLYLAPESIRPTYLVQLLKPKFIEYQHFQMASELDKRAIVNISQLDSMWQQLHIIDDLITDIICHMPAQAPVGWQLVCGGQNHLKLPTVGRQRPDSSVADQASLNSYVLGHFGVMSYTYDRGYFIGHVLGYLFCCYYFAHLSISYGVTPLAKSVVEGYDYATLDTPKMVRLLQALDVHCKRRVYQLAVFCAKLSYYSTDKRIEKLLIGEVNDFDKKLQQNNLDELLNNGLMPDTPE